MTRERLTYRITMVFLYVTVALTVGTLFFVRLPYHRERVELGSMVYGSAHKPYAYRALMPGLVRVAAVAGDAALARMGKTRADSPLAAFGARLLNDRGAPAEVLQWSYEYAILFVLTVACLVGFGWLLRALTRQCYPEVPRFVSDIAPLLALAVIPLVFFRQSNLVYDPMTLLLFTLGVHLIARRSHLAFLLAFPLIALNKETALLLVPLVLLREAGRIGPARLAALTVVPLASFAALRLWQAHALRDRPGGLVEWHLEYNLAAFGDPGFYLKTLGAVLPLAVLVGSGWARKPRFLRQGLVVTAIPLVASALFLGVLGEMRDYYEAYPFVFLLAIPTAVEVFGVHPIAAARPAADRSRAAL